MAKWKILDDNPVDIIKTILKNRGLKDKEHLDKFLNPSLKQLKEVQIDKKQLTKAKTRIAAAIAAKEMIIVYCDYDTDGITGGAILWETLALMGAKTLPYVPHRIDEGYGLSIKGIDHVQKEYNARLIITVDQGITATDKVAYAKKRGIDVIISDHHTIPANPPKPLATIHTTSLSGAGVAFYFSQQLLPDHAKTKEHLILAGLGTVADLVPLVDFNRVIAKFALEALKKTKRLGLQALIQEAGIADRDIGTYEISHMLAPRINATGRLTHALDALRLLCTTDRKRAYELAKLLNETNLERQTILLQGIENAVAKLAAEPTKDKLIIVGNAEYHEGVIGLIAGRLVEQFYKPAIVLSLGKEFSKASARSINGFNIIEAIRNFSNLLVDAGGHPMAAGFTIETGKISHFQKEITTFINQHLDPSLLEKELRIDCPLTSSQIKDGLYRQLQKLQPFGMGNPEPLFVTYNLEVLQVTPVGREKNHLRLLLKSKDSQPIQAIAFGMGKKDSQINNGDIIDIAYYLSENIWNGRSSLQLKIKDLHKN